MAIANLKDFILTTTRTNVTGPDDHLREFMNQTYSYGLMLKGAGKVFAGGTKVSDQLSLEDPGLAQFFDSDSETFNWLNPQTLVGWGAEWRKMIGHFAWQNDEKDLQGVGNMTQDARFKVFERVYEKKRGDRNQSIYNLCESAMWALPDATVMEGTVSNGRPYSVPVFINEGTAVSGNRGVHDNWGTSVIEELNNLAAANSRFQCQHATYVDGTENILDAMTTAHRISTFKGEQYKGAVFQDTSESKRKIFVSGFAWDTISNLSRTEQDQWRMAPNDAGYGTLINKGVPIYYVSELDSAGLYENGDSSGFVDDSVAQGATAITLTSGGARAYLVDCEWLHPFHHDTDFWQEHEVTSHHNQPLSWVAPVTMKMNLIARSLQRQCMIFPT